MSNSMLDSTLDDLADLPEFKPYPAGVHRAIVSFERKEINKKEAIELKLTGVATEELTNPDTDQPITQGQETQCLYILTTNDGKPNEVAQGKLKEILKVLGPATGESSIKGIMEAAKGMEVLVVTKVKKGKDGGNDNTDIVQVSVV